MTTFDLNNTVLSDLFRINSIEIPAGAALVFVGIRGCLPLDPADTAFRQAHTLSIREIDHKNLRCTMVQWKPASGDIAVFAGSTVPSIANILGFRARPPRKSNCMSPGFYRNYVKGKHRPVNTRNHHDGFRQNGQPLAIRRTFDNTFYDNFDTIEISTGCDDNMHAAWTMDTDSEYFSSAGCQVIMGIPFCDSTRNSQSDNKGPWKAFKDNGYAVDQTTFPYALCLSAEVFKIANSKGRPVSPRLKFGSSGDLVKQLQQKLIDMNFLSGTADGDFGKNTFNAVKRFQLENFGLAAVDCVVGPVTAAALGVVWTDVVI
ncbi:MAG: peptidoglycan-binding domain-containing protein [Chitinophagaceae bacterium]